MKTTKDDYADLLRTVLDNLSGKSKWLIGIDGNTGAGKTWIGERLETDLMDARLIDLDDYLEKRTGSFINALRYEDLRDALTHAADQFHVTIVAGVCLLEVLDRLDVTPDLLIYAMKVSSAGRRSDDHLYDDTISEAVALEDVRESWKASGAIGPFLDEELIRYHKRVRPQYRADIVFERIAD